MAKACDRHIDCLLGAALRAAHGRLILQLDHPHMRLVIVPGDIRLGRHLVPGPPGLSGLTPEYVRGRAISGRRRRIDLWR